MSRYDVTADAPVLLLGHEAASVLAALRPPFALLAREGGAVEVLTGDVVDVDVLDDVPLHDEEGRAQEVLALVPFRQVRELGFDAVDDGAPLRCLVVRERALVADACRVLVAVATPL